MISCICPACGKVFRAKEGAVGKKAKCRQCGHFFVVTAGPHIQNSQGVEVKPTSIPDGLTTHAESDGRVGGNPTERRSRQRRTRPDPVFATSQSFAAQGPPPLPGAAIMSPGAATRRCTTEAAAATKPRWRRAATITLALAATICVPITVLIMRNFGTSVFRGVRSSAARVKGVPEVTSVEGELANSTPTFPLTWEQLLQMTGRRGPGVQVFNDDAGNVMRVESSSGLFVLVAVERTSDGFSVAAANEWAVADFTTRPWFTSSESTGLQELYADYVASGNREATAAKPIGRFNVSMGHDWKYHNMPCFIMLPLKPAGERDH
jgi:hypothetical protein